MKLLITAGGQGTKIWPMSREKMPKQFQKLVGAKTLIQYQLETLLKAYSIKDIFVSTKEMYVDIVKEQVPEVLDENIIIEPDFKKGRGPGEGYAALKLEEKKPGELFMIIQADCIRSPEDKFLKMIEGAEKLVKKDKKFISGGQKAIKPDMGSDYLKLGERIKTEDDLFIYSVDEFVYRLGDYKKTEDLIENFHVSTHCNHMCWYPELFLNAYEKYKPDWFESLMKIRETFGKHNEKELTNKIYSEMSEGQTEEVTKYIFQEGYIILLPFKWTDVGTWGTVYDYFTHEGEVYSDGKSVVVDSKDCLIKGDQKKLIALLGLENIAVIDTPDALLVCRKDRAGDIKSILDELKKNNLEEYL